MTDTLVRPAVRSEGLQGHLNLRDWIDIAEGMGALRRLNGCEWDLEIGGITEMVALGAADPSCLLFDEIKGYPPGWRVMTNAFANRDLASKLLGIPLGLTSTGMTQAWRARSKELRLTPVEEVSRGPIFENVHHGADIDLYRFPTPRWHEQDGGRFLGTGCMVVTRDPDDAQINLGAYRMMVQDRDKIGLYISPGKHGRVHREKYFSRGEPMPVAAAFGMDPLLHLGASLGLPVATNEYEWVGAVRDAPVEVIPGPVTGLPIPAHAEIVVEGYVHAGRVMDEGPFGEWTGYYGSDMRPETYVQVEALYHRNEPIILGSPPMRPPGDNYHARRTMMHALIWDALEAAGVPDVRGVTLIPAAGAGMLVVSIKQRYAGHAKQAALVAGQSRSGAYLGRYIVVVDEDVDTDNVDQVLWAIWTRSDPEESLDLIRNCWSTPLDPRIPPEKRARGQFSNSRLVIDATRPYHWRDQFPAVAATSPELEASLRQKWGDELFR